MVLKPQAHHGGRADTNRKVDILGNPAMSYQPILSGRDIMMLTKLSMAKTWEGDDWA
jgi:hypothetical protein